LPATTFPVRAGATYYVQASDIWSGGGALKLNLDFIPPPPNDDFASATAVGSLPFSQSVDVSTGSTEPGEPTPSCGYGNPSSSVWYAYTPTTSGSLSASASGPFTAGVAAYTGTSLADLTQIGCRVYGNLLTFHVDAGTTYYFQASSFFGSGGTLQFNLAVAPQPVVNLGYFPSDPSIFDTVQFYDFSYDPGQAGIQSEAWTFGDGASAAGCCPTHRYAADDDYTATLTVTTVDGRTASGRRTIHVQTHDVAITKRLMSRRSW